MRVRLVILLLLTTLGLGAQEVLPKPEHLVTDAANVLKPEEVEALEQKLEALHAAGLAQAVIYLAPSLPEGAVMENLTLRSVNAWGVGDAATNNGIAIFAFITNRKLRIEVGSGLESRISDQAADAIIRERIAPAFRAGEYAQGLTAAVERIETLLSVRRIIGPNNAPRVLRRENPRYPEKARQARIQGVVELEVLIDAQGRVVDATVTKPLSHGLSDAAVEAVKQWTFQPVTADGKAVPALIDVAFSFRL